MLDELLKEINELKEFKKMYESQTKDKQRMSDELFKLMTEKYNNTSYEIRKENYTKEMCRCCRWHGCCNIEIPEDIEKPIKSDKAWIPAKIACGEFKWD